LLSAVIVVARLSSALPGVCSKPAIVLLGTQGGILLDDTDSNTNGGNGFVFSGVTGVQLADSDQAQDNQLNGFQFTNVSGASTNSASAESNKGYGFEVQASCFNSFDAVKASSNGSSGIYLRCVNGPFGNCFVSGTGNSVFNSQPDDNDTYGIEVEKGEGGDEFYGNVASGNDLGDAIDHNPNCGTNLWWGNGFTFNATPPCVNTGL
jgi:hypothetical protein